MRHSEDSSVNLYVMSSVIRATLKWLVSYATPTLYAVGWLVDCLIAFLRILFAFLRILFRVVSFLTSTSSNTGTMLLRRYCQERHDTKQNSLESKKIPPRGRKKFSRECPSKCSLEPEHAYNRFHLVVYYY